MKIYRVEGPEGIGPYQGGIAEDIHYENPDPYTDGVFEYKMVYKRGLAWAKEFVYGFTSKEQALEWFTEESLKDFEKQGYYLTEYEISGKKVRKGKSQCVFRKEHAKKLSSKVTVH